MIFSVLRSSWSLQHGQNQFVGICIPYACNKEDMQIMVEQSIKADDDKTNEDRTTDIIKIKSHYDHYYMKHDRTFWLIM